MSVLSQKRAIFERLEKLPKASSPTSGALPVIMAVRIHLFPFRTQKLSSTAPIVLAHYGLGETSAKFSQQPSGWAVLPREMSKHKCSVFAVTETAVDLTAVEKSLPDFNNNSTAQKCGGVIVLLL